MQTVATNKTNLIDVFRICPTARVEITAKDLLDLSYDLETRLERKLKDYIGISEKVKKNRLVDIKEAARRLGVSARTVDRMVDRGELKKISVGGVVRFSETEIEDIIAGRIA